MASEVLFKKIQKLRDLDLALLTCFVAREHCVINTVPAYIDELIRDLELVITKTFGLRMVVIECCKHTSVDEFDHALLYQEGIPAQVHSSVRNGDEKSPSNLSFNVHSRPVMLEYSCSDRFLASNVIIAKNLDKAPQQVQLRALELIKTKQINLKTSAVLARYPSLLIALLVGREGPRLNKHLNDAMFISHRYCPDSHFPTVESDDEVSDSSVGKRYSTHQASKELIEPMISASEIVELINLSIAVTFSIEVKQYQMNIISFIRMHRAVAGGITAIATKHFDLLARCLASLHNLAYVSPSLVALAARKIYIHRMKIVAPENERSMQWGSDLQAVTELLDGVGAEEVLKDVLGNSGAEAPL
ncbi:hypothetical protein K3495_g3782 [Podosphaera aphanis]|nr:hypothetical protein K3495_g3782 [Podosphaera aphanis]